MTYKTLEGVLHPDGTVTLSPDERPDHPVRVLVTLLEASDDEVLAELGDYLHQLTDYEERLARGVVGCAPRTGYDPAGVSGWVRGAHPTCSPASARCD